MRDANAVAQWLRESAQRDAEPDDHQAFSDVVFDGLPDTEDAFTVTLVDGTKFLVSVTKIEEGGR